MRPFLDGLDVGKMNLMGICRLQMQPDACTERYVTSSPMWTCTAWCFNTPETRNCHLSTLTTIPGVLLLQVAVMVNHVKSVQLPFFDRFWIQHLPHPVSQKSDSLSL